MGELKLMALELQDAREILELSLMHYELADERFGRATSELMLGEVELRIGRPRNAERRFREGERVYVSRGRENELIERYEALARALMGTAPSQAALLRRRIEVLSAQ
jgi:hypothetical protein